MKSKITAMVLKDSVSPELGNVRIVTVRARYPRFIHSEVMTHRMFSRNAASSRAIPVKRQLWAVLTDPAMPIHWGRNRPGMQAKATLGPIAEFFCRVIWRLAAVSACVAVCLLMLLRLHKQTANRILEPWVWITTQITSTEWSNFFALRMHPDAQPEFQELARCIHAAMEASKPDVLVKGQWHLPHIETVRYSADEVIYCWGVYHVRDLTSAIKVSVACSAWISTEKDGQTATFEQCDNMYKRLTTAEPMHASPLEHQATPQGNGTHGPLFFMNLRGWWSHRFELETFRTAFKNLT